MKFGVQLPHFGPRASAAGAVAAATRVEELGFDSVWTGDHVVYPADLVERFGAQYSESVTTLAFAAARTRRVRVGTCVLVLPYRNPLVLSKQLATLDVLSGGRLTVGVGAGWLPEEFRALGAAFAERGAMTDEAIRIMRALWSEDRARFSGRFFEFGDLLFAPRPLRPPPVWVGGASARSMRRAAELGDGWIPVWHPPSGRGLSPGARREKIDALREAAGRVGRPITHEVGGLMPLAIVDRAPAGDPQPLIGTPEALAAMLREYAAAGLDHVVLNPFYGVPPALMPTDLGAFDRLLARFARDVRPFA